LVVAAAGLDIGQLLQQQRLQQRLLGVCGLRPGGADGILIGGDVGAREAVFEVVEQMDGQHPVGPVVFYDRLGLLLFQIGAHEAEHGPRAPGVGRGAQRHIAQQVGGDGVQGEAT